MPIISINEIEYDTDDLSEDALAQLRSIEFVEAELSRLNAQIAAMTTAKSAYISALQDILGSEAPSG